MQIQPLFSNIASLLPGAARPGKLAAVRVAGAGENAPSADSPHEADTEDSLEISEEAEALIEGELTPEERQQVKELQIRDREVRAHEQAHLAAAGPYALGGPTYEHETGPDGNRYAVGGEVQIDTSPVPDDPEATIAKARVVRAAALAPAKPSAQDQAVAAAAAKMESEARAELMKQEQEERAAEGTEAPQPGEFDERSAIDETGRILDIAV
ncbi:MAG: hypothetical protein KY475_00260 [Planctomycetes bacterium]|nr:hypothetical protein [Planctomycetota bacterium]